MPLTLAQLRALVTSVDRGSVTAAATQLGVSQSAVSHAIAGLEKEVGGRLLNREAGLASTALGDRVLEHARAVLASVDALECAIEQDGAATGTVRLAAVPTACQGLLPKLMQLWQAKLPNVEVQVYEGDDDEMDDWLEAGVVDAAILITPSPMPAGGLVVAVDEFRAVMRRDHPLASAASVPLEELHEDGLIVSSGGCEGQVLHLHKLAGLEYRFSHRVREMGTMFRMVQQGVGVSIVPSLGEVMLPDDLVMKAMTPRAERTLVLAGPHSRPWHPLAHALVDAL